MQPHTHIYSHSLTRPKQCDSDKNLFTEKTTAYVIMSNFTKSIPGNLRIRQCQWPY